MSASGEAIKKKLSGETLANSLVEAIKTAKTNYSEYIKTGSADRGVPGGFFSSFRHGSWGLGKAAGVTIRASIVGTHIDAELTTSLNLLFGDLDAFFQDPSTQYNVHSFASFVLDELNKIIGFSTKSAYAESDWKSIREELLKQAPREIEPVTSTEHWSIG